LDAIELLSLVAKRVVYLSFATLKSSQLIEKRNPLEKEQEWFACALVVSLSSIELAAS
jgi:hypothetical protein